MEGEIISVTTSNVCRLCLKQAQIELLKNLTNDIIPIIVDFFKVFLDTQLPDYVCEKCFEILTQIATFVENCRHSHGILTQNEGQEVITVNVKNEIVDLEDVMKAEEVIIEDTVCLKNDEDFVIESKNNEPVKSQKEINQPTLVKICKKCGEAVKSLPSHYKVSKECQTFKCSYCAQCFNTKALLNFHKKSQHPSTKNDEKSSKVCPICGESITSRKDHCKGSRKCRLRNHKCPECNLYFSTPRTLQYHQTAKHWNESNDMYVCHICSKSVKYEANLRRHIDAHKCEKRFICEKCGHTCTTKVALQYHMNRHEGLKPFICSHCGKGFTTRTCRYLHEKRHFKPKPTDASRSHSGSKSEAGNRKGEYICDVCNKTFTLLRALKLHKVSHDENRTYACELCNRKFPSRMWMLKHAATHDTIKKFQCQHCPKSFKQKAELKIHTRIHTDDRPFKCTECPKAFRQTAHLSYHLSLHRGEKPYSCKFCNKAFAVKCNLTVHLRTHTGEKPYPCHMCDLRFRDASARKRHVLLKHGEGEVQFIGSVDLDQIEGNV